MGRLASTTTVEQISVYPDGSTVVIEKTVVTEDGVFLAESVNGRDVDEEGSGVIETDPLLKDVLDGKVNTPERIQARGDESDADRGGLSRTTT